ncbi:hypothetical protein MCEGE10_02570 [Flavobacteriaceae bacterium]
MFFVYLVLHLGVYCIFTIQISQRLYMLRQIHTIKETFCTSPNVLRSLFLTLELFIYK